MEAVISCGFLLLGSLLILLFSHQEGLMLLAAIVLLLAFVPLMAQCLLFWGRLWKKTAQGPQTPHDSGATAQPPSVNSTNQFPDNPR